MSKQTWTIEEGYKVTRVRNQAGLLIAEVLTGSDARLIASAPELLEALKLARRLLSQLGYSREQINAAIAKAGTGK